MSQAASPAPSQSDAPEPDALEASAAAEIERKFLVPSPPEDLRSHSSEQLQQGYLAVTEDGTEVRLRRRGDHCSLTVKSPLEGPEGLARWESEVPVTAEQFHALWPATRGKRVEKERFQVPVAGATAEVDVYDGDLRGLVTAEVEFPSPEAAEAFEAPPWFGREVTSDSRYKNQRLASHGLPTAEVGS
ncbi:MAG: CYTH domain-containing protein [Acidobacteriota bacterium]|nr:CYTH domain-containing protein [Acidobacteriota bacterium]